MKQRMPEAVREAPSSKSDKSSPKKKRWSLAQVICVIGVFFGCGIFVYPSAADWFARLGQQDAIAGYAQAVEDLPSQQVQQMLQGAHEYNERLPIVNMIDPYGPNAEEFTGDASERDLYESMLRVGKDQPMSWISIQSENITMPIYHGTAESTLQRGAGHLFGSSLPVGGASTRAIITGHAGDPRAQLFTKVHDLKVGDTFALNTLGQGLYYRVRDLRVIEPEEVEGLGIEQGKDLVTLITCTPIGVNSHRLIVTGERIPHPEFQTAAEYPLDADKLGVGFPWWAVPLVALPALAGWIARPAGARKKGRAARSAGQGDAPQADSDATA